METQPTFRERQRQGQHQASQLEDPTLAQSSVLGEGLDLLSMDLVDGKRDEAEQAAMIKYQSVSSNLYRCPKCNGTDFKKRDGALLVCTNCRCVL